MLTWAETIQLVLTLVGVPALIIGTAIYLLSGGLQTFALRPLQRCYEGIDVHESPRLGDVSFVYHTYRGLFLWSTMDEHRVFASPDEATKLLRRLLRFNLTWGMMSYGQLFIPVLALGNYWAQKSAIQTQCRSAEHQLGSILQPENTPADAP